ncbi:MAG: hypothetical protein AAFR53_13045, partial [Pseudomonadota bacterium]
APVKAVILKSRHGGGDIADRQLGVGAEDAAISVELVSPEKEGFGPFASLKRRFSGQSLDQAMEMDGIQFEDAKAKVRINGRTRTVTLAGSGGMNALIDLSDAVKRDPGRGHPTRASIEEAFQEIIEDVAVSMLT